MALADANITYVPDFLANCGGIVSVGAEFAGLDRQDVDDRIERSIVRVREVLTEARQQGRLPLDLALERAQLRVGGVAW